MRGFHFSLFHFILFHIVSFYFSLFNSFVFELFFTRESSYCFQDVLAIAILSVRLSVCLSRGLISQKRCKVGSPNLHHRLPGRL